MAAALSSSTSSRLPSPLPTNKDVLISQIPVPLLISIFSLLGDANLARISRVCRQWRVIYVDSFRSNIALNLLNTSKDKIRKEHLVLDTSRVYSSFLLNDNLWAFQTECSLLLFSMKEKRMRAISPSNSLVGETDTVLFLINSYSSNPSLIVCLEKKMGDIVFKLDIQKVLASEKKVGIIRAVRMISEDPFGFMVVTEDGTVFLWELKNGVPIFKGDWQLLKPGENSWEGSYRKVTYAHFLSSHLVVQLTETRKVSDSMRGALFESKAFLDIIHLDSKEKIRTTFFLSELYIFGSNIVIAKEHIVLGYEIKANQLVQKWEHKISASHYNLVKNDKNLLLIASDGHLHILNVNTGKVIHQLAFTNAPDPIIHGKVYGNMLALVCEQRIAIFDLKSGNQVATPEVQKPKKPSYMSEGSLYHRLKEIDKIDDEFDEVFIDVEFSNGQLWYLISNKKTGKVILEGLRFIPEFKKPVVKVVVEKQPDPEKPPLFPQPTIPHPPATSNASPPKKPEATQKISYLALSIVLLFAVSAVVHFGARYPRIRLLAMGAGSILAVGIAYSLIVRTKKQMSVLVQTIGQLRHVRVWS